MIYKNTLTEDQCRIFKEAYIKAFYIGKPTPPEPYDELRHDVADLMNCVDIPVHCIKTAHKLEKLIDSHKILENALKGIRALVLEQWDSDDIKRLGEITEEHNDFVVSVINKALNNAER